MSESQHVAVIQLLPLQKSPSKCVGSMPGVVASSVQVNPAVAVVWMYHETCQRCQLECIVLPASYSVSRHLHLQSCG